MATPTGTLLSLGTGGGCVRPGHAGYARRAATRAAAPASRFLEVCIMLIGVPREIKNHEYRVGLTPDSVHELVHHGHRVLVERGAGDGAGMPDDSYRAAGAEIVPDAASVFAAAEMIVKVKEPQPTECRLLRTGQVLFTYLHLAPDPEQTRLLLAAGVTAIAYETVTDRHGSLPLLAPMSEVAGRLAAGRRVLPGESPRRRWRALAVSRAWHPGKSSSSAAAWSATTPRRSPPAWVPR